MRFYSKANARLCLTADQHDYSGGNPLLGLLLLLGIPAGICCCCRKKIFKKKATTTATLQVHRAECTGLPILTAYSRRTELGWDIGTLSGRCFSSVLSVSVPHQTSPGTAQHYVPSGPTGPSPPYNTPGQPGSVSFPDAFRDRVDF